MEKKEKKRCNPNGANQYKFDPRQALFLSYYIDPKSKTFSNAYQSAMRAGYEEAYAAQITAKMPEWLGEKVRDDVMLDKAEKALNEMLEIDEDAEANLKKIKQDTAKFVAERLNKNKWAQRQEHTGKDGKDLVYTWGDKKPNK